MRRRASWNVPKVSSNVMAQLAACASWNPMLTSQLCPSPARPRRKVNAPVSGEGDCMGARAAQEAPGASHHAALGIEGPRIPQSLNGSKEKGCRLAGPPLTPTPREWFRPACGCSGPPAPRAAGAAWVACPPSARHHRMKGKVNRASRQCPRCLPSAHPVFPLRRACPRVPPALRCARRCCTQAPSGHASIALPRVAEASPPSWRYFRPRHALGVVEATPPTWRLFRPGRRRPAGGCPCPRPAAYPWVVPGHFFTLHLLLALRLHA